MRSTELLKLKAEKFYDHVLAPSSGHFLHIPIHIIIYISVVLSLKLYAYVGMVQVKICYTIFQLKLSK